MATQVVELKQDWNIKTGLDITTGVKKFIDSNARSTATAVDLPSVGSKWDDSGNYDYLLCKSIDQRWLGDRDDYQIYECNYDSNPIDNSEFNIIANLNDEFPQAVELSASIQNYTNEFTISGAGEDATPAWRWTSDNNPTFTATEIARDLMRIKIEVLMSFSITRYIEPRNAAKFVMDTCRPLLGKVNNKLFYGIQIGCAMYMGTTIEQVGKRNKIKYKTVSKFSLRFVPMGNAIYGGWNYSLKPTENKYNYIIFGVKGDAVTEGSSNIVTDKTFYDEADFDPLIKDSRAAITLVVP
jgi:hypothetical protein